MFHGELVGIFICPRRGDVPLTLDAVEAVAGRGLVGDRYFLAEGVSKPDTEVTLIESEALESMAATYRVALAEGQSRRNLLTRDVPLNHLVGKDFRVGTVRLHGIRLCEPCGHLERLTLAGVEKGLRHRGGMRAQIIEGGMLRVGDRVVPAVS